MYKDIKRDSVIESSIWCWHFEPEDAIIAAKTLKCKWENPNIISPTKQKWSKSAKREFNKINKPIPLIAAINLK